MFYSLMILQGYLDLACIDVKKRTVCRKLLGFNLKCKIQAHGGIIGSLKCWRIVIAVWLERNWKWKQTIDSNQNQQYSNFECHLVDLKNKNQEIKRSRRMTCFFSSLRSGFIFCPHTWAINIRFIPSIWNCAFRLFEHSLVHSWNLVFFLPLWCQHGIVSLNERKSKSTGIK